jgi:hypothetical protein
MSSRESAGLFRQDYRAADGHAGIVNFRYNFPYTEHGASVDFLLLAGGRMTSSADPECSLDGVRPVPCRPMICWQ